MSINLDEIQNIIDKKVKDVIRDFDFSEIGHVISVKDGIATLYGLQNTFMGELIEFSDGVVGVVVDISHVNVNAMILGKEDSIKASDIAKRTGQSIKVPTGKAMLGRIVDALGNPIDGLGPLNNVDEFRCINAPAPGVMQRKSVHEPMHTGIMAIDSLIPIGRGQRQLIIGDRQTGKTTIAIDTILNHLNSASSDDSLYCVYVAIGQKMSTVAQIAKRLSEAGAMSYTTIVAAPASSPASMQFLAPYTGCAIGEYFRNNAMHALAIYDDLSKHAVAYRQVSLLLRRPPGREAFPGDIFYIHSRLLERSAKMSDKCGAGSLTALPIIETQAGDVSSYIPTNVISITDGQIFLDTELFNNGVRPAINIGLSVSRVGSAAQTKSMKQVAGTLKLDLAQYREMEAFSQFSSDLDKSTQELIKNGQKVVELLKQLQHSPINNENQVILIFAAVNNYLRNVDDIANFKTELLSFVQIHDPGVIVSIKNDGKITDDVRKKLVDLIERFLNT